MLRSLDTYDSRSPDSSTRNAWSLNSELARITFGAALEAFLTARAAEGASPATITWSRAGTLLGRDGGHNHGCGVTARSPSRAVADAYAVRDLHATKGSALPLRVSSDLSRSSAGRPDRRTA